MELLIFICVGIFTGLSAGLLGVGGGIISVPAMVILLPYFDVSSHLVMHIAIATSLALIIPTSLVSAYSHFKQNAIVWSYVFQLAPGLVLGGLIGAYLVVLSDREILQSAFAIFLIIISIHMLIGKKPQAISVVKINHILPASAIGTISSLMGVGGGTMTVPYLVWRGITLPKAIGTSSLCGLPIALSSSLTFFVLNSNSDASSASASIYSPAFAGIVIGAMIFTPIGAKLAHQINVILLKKIFIVMLLAIAIKLLAS